MLPQSRSNFDALVKSPDAALRRILSHCGVRQVLLIPSYLRALAAAFLRARRENRLFRTFYGTIKVKPAIVESNMWLTAPLRNIL